MTNQLYLCGNIPGIPRNRLHTGFDDEWKNKLLFTICIDAVIALATLSVLKTISYYWTLFE
jgi:hypothetical protein